MDVTQILDGLNDEQRAVVSMPLQNALVLAGAGSGKTRVLTQRIAWLVQVQQCSPYGILAVTFTNKAAGEMRGRIEDILGNRLPGMWVGTFHGIAHRLLRKHWQAFGLPESFQVIDSDDQYRLVRRIMRQINIDESRWSPKQAQWFINQQKDAGLRAEQVKVQDHFSDTMRNIYLAYEQTCQRAGLVDFAELLLAVHELWQKCPDLLQHYQQRFQFVLVDEFQDTNSVQYVWLRELIGQGANNTIMAVGDDDQSIYGWRGAKIENIQQFQKDFNDVSLFRLEQNYRSSSTILQAANGLIAHNHGRLGKNLWTAGDVGEAITLYSGFNEIDEARFIGEQIVKWHEQGNALSDVAILYRSNAQSRVLEEALLQRSIAYRVYGGLRFFERAEIKDVLAYLRLLVNHQDDAAFERIVNTPTRGIGERTLQQVRHHARDNNISLWQAMENCVNQQLLAARACSACQQFLTLINEMADEYDSLSLTELTEMVIEQSGLEALHRNDKSEKGRTRLENLSELVSAATEFEHAVLEENMEDSEEVELSSPLLLFLTQAALDAGDEGSQQTQDCVQLMTLHAAKGLEFPFVIISGMEEGLFPHSMSYDEAGRLEEERRLCYVGMTRARRRLFFTAAQSRRLHGQEVCHRLSRFISEIPAKFIEECRLKADVRRPLMATKINECEFSVGQSVNHPKFGEGIVINYEGDGANARVQVNFNHHGSKWLVLAYANLESV